MTPRKEDLVSLRDLGEVRYRGLPPLPSVGVWFWMERLQGSSRIIHMRLTRPGLTMELNPLRDFNLESVGRDYLRLETLGREMIVVGNYLTDISVRPQDAGILVTLHLMDEELPLELAAGRVGRWDWFLNPAEVPGKEMPFLAPCKVKDLYREQLAA